MNREVCKEAICDDCEQQDLDNEDFDDHQDLRDMCLSCDATLCPEGRDMRTPYCGYCMLERIKNLEARLERIKDLEARLAALEPKPKAKWYIRSTSGDGKERKELSKKVSAQLELDGYRTRPRRLYSHVKLFGDSEAEYRVDLVSGAVEFVKPGCAPEAAKWIVERD